MQNNLQSLNYNSIKDARLDINNHIPDFSNTIERTLKEEKYTKGYNINYGLNHFPEKEYQDVVYKEGDYESLVITIGDGVGENFWCVLFPPLCLLDEEEQKPVEYKSLVKELIDKYF